MGLFKSIKKAFKKVTRGIKKAVKGVVKGVKKVVKKISSSKILKALAIAAAVVVTGGAAVAAFTGGTAASGTFAGWMMNASQAVTGGTLFGTSTAVARAAGTAAKFIATPFKAVGTALGSAAATVTDFTGLTTEAGRMGVTPDMQTAMAEAQVKAGVQLSPDNLNLEQSIQRVSDAGGGSVADIKSAIDSGLTTKEAIIQQASITTTPTTLLGQEQAAMAAAKSAGASPETMAYLRQQSAQTATAYGVPSADIVSAGFPEAAANQSFAEKYPKTTGFVTAAGTSVANTMLNGYAQSLMAGDPTGRGGAGIGEEGGARKDPISIYSNELNINPDDYSKYFTFSNTPEAGNMPLFQQQTIEVT
jgi:hypothetical protein